MGEANVAMVGAAHGSELYEGAQRLREVVLRKPFGLTLSEAELADDLSRQHFCAVDRDVVVGAVSLKPLADGTAQLKQMAVAEDRQKRQIGARLLSFAEAWGARQGYRRIVLHARLGAEGFYAKFGYLAEGETFMENTTPHILMSKRLECGGVLGRATEEENT
ncbi:MAG: GNAT family N-acetyltransferase [Methyloceanibacter sp.]|uniref:GNAT family N-acetyltransferase n=1 Tax=Methyloceanibacter sp. TaxID=1965321 RepID=UPI003D9AD648